MALPSTGAISLNQVNVELQRVATASINMNDNDVRTLAQKVSGAISMSDLRGKAWWVLKTGSLYEMVSANSPSPFTCAKSTVGSVAWAGNEWDAFNSNATACRGYQCSANEGTVYDIYFNVHNKYKPTKIAFDYYSGNTINITMTITGYYADGNTVTLYTQNTTASSSANTISVSLTQPISRIRISLIKTGGIDDSIYLRKCQVTEWYEK